MGAVSTRGTSAAPKAKQVLELLLVARGDNVTKDRLADQLWGEVLPPPRRKPSREQPRRRLDVSGRM